MAKNVPVDSSEATLSDPQTKPVKELNLPGSASHPTKVVVKKTGAIGAFLRPIGFAVAFLLMSYGLLTLGTNYYRSYHRHLEHVKPVHLDKTLVQIFAPKSELKPDQIEMIIRDQDGYLRRVAANKTETDKFVNTTLHTLDGEHKRVKAAILSDIDRSFDYAFADRELAVNAYADWFFEWKRSYIVLKETLTSAASRFVETGKYENLSEAVERDVKEYFMKNYSERVLKPEIRDQRITQGLERAVRRGHETYRRIIATSDAKLQLFLARYTKHLEDIPANKPMTKVTLDWDAQKWKAPVYLTEDKAFEGIVGIGRVAAGGTIGAFALRPVMNRIMARSFGSLSRRFAVSMGSRIAMAGRGAAAGTVVEPVGGQIVGAIVGVAIGAAADYFINKANENFKRADFLKANNQALDTTIEAWREKIKSNVAEAVDQWFNEARASVVLASKKSS